MQIRILSVAAAIWAATIASAFGTSISEVPSHDNHMSARVISGSNLTNQNNGLVSVVVIGGVLTDDFTVGILRWDLSSVPSGETASTDGTLTLTRTTTTNLNGAQVFEVYRVKSSNAGWVEGTGSTGSPPVANAGGSTWNNLAHPGTPWVGGPGLGSPGTDGYEGLTPNSATPIATFAFDNGGSTSGGPTKVDITIPMSVLNDWISNPADNAGLFIRKSSISATNEVFRFTSRNGTTSNRPVLSFTTIPEPSSIFLIAVGSCMAVYFARTMRKPDGA